VRRQKAKGRRQKAKGRRQKAKVRVDSAALVSQGIYFKAGSFTEHQFQPIGVPADWGAKFFPL
jgi:hypothetical protein